MMKWLAALVGIALTMLLGLALVLTSGAKSQGRSGECSLLLNDQRAAEQLTPEQVSNARIVVGVGLERGVPLRGLVIAIATARQESSLRNLAYGDRDSVGLFQQRPSAGWGTAEQILDPVYASTRFYQALEEVPGWELLPLTVAAQAVQRSAYPDAYAQWETMAAELVAAVTGASPEALTCPVDDHMQLAEASGSTGQWPAEQMGPDGLTLRTRTAMHAVMHAAAAHRAVVGRRAGRVRRTRSTARR